MKNLYKSIKIDNADTSPIGFFYYYNNVQPATTFSCEYSVTGINANDICNPIYDKANPKQAAETTIPITAVPMITATTSPETTAAATETTSGTMALALGLTVILIIIIVPIVVIAIIVVVVVLLVRRKNKPPVPPAVTYTAPPQVPPAVEKPEVKAKFCSSCGGQVVEGATFCPNCGNKLS